jgi:hypothetical protein
MIITSGGIYGFLSGAYQETATKSEFLDKSLAVLQTKQNRFEEQKTDLTLEKTQLNTTISDLRTSLSNPTSVSYWDETAQQVITTTSSSTRRALQSELKSTIADRDTINVRLEAVMDSVMRIDTELLELEIGNEEQRELGPLKYLAETTGEDMGTVVNWFLLLIVFVFDPLAIAMVVAANFAFAQIKPEEDNLDIPEEVPDMREPLGDWADKEVVIEDEELYTNEDEKRMDIIGQNGNDGIHYDQEPTIESEPIELDDIIVTPETEERIRLENDLDEEGEYIGNEDIYDEKNSTNPDDRKDGEVWMDDSGQRWQKLNGKIHKYWGTKNL